MAGTRNFAGGAVGLWIWRGFRSRDGSPQICLDTARELGGWYGFGTESALLHFRNMVQFATDSIQQELLSC